mmetsp:Transcript_40392/g.94899  ORF Transcript_40392/g.94899 Transcript_40392/m.94899 type:complete len:147 (+) Transcript_40392:1993-2433(+)
MEKELRMSETNTKTNMVVVIHFVKGAFDFPIPVKTGDMNTSLIELVRQVKHKHQIFFAFSERDCNLIRDRKGEIGNCCKEANLKVTLGDLRNNIEKYTVSTLYHMTDVKTNHHHILFFIQPLLQLPQTNFLWILNVNTYNYVESYI